MLNTTPIAQALSSGLINDDQLAAARRMGLQENLSVEDALQRAGYLDSRQLRDLRSQVTGVAVVDLQEVDIQQEALALLSASQAGEWLALPLWVAADGSRCQVAVANVADVIVLGKLNTALPDGMTVEFRLASRDELRVVINRVYQQTMSLDRVLLTLSSDREQAAVRLVDAVFTDAARLGVSDIHLEPGNSGLLIRFRCDGLLASVRTLPLEHWPSMLVRIKVLGGMDIAESRAPQDGRYSLVVDDRDIDARLSVFPFTEGECVVARLLDRIHRAVSLEALCESPACVDQLSELADARQGVVIVSGPTGSGKTTTLYALLARLRDETRNVVTLEDPVELRIPGIQQCSIGKTARIDFADGVRALLRQDPDVMLVGETRDRDTGDMVLRAALTGHLVLTTLHANSALASFSRLQNLGLELQYLADNLVALIGQRLVRRLCRFCRHEVTVPNRLQMLMSSWDIQTESLAEATGCSQCSHTGYSGRLAIMEVYQPDSAVHALLHQNPSAGSVVLKAQQGGHRGLYVNALEALAKGSTSLAEIERVFGAVKSQECLAC